jgi:hypothetical protein
MRLWYDWRTDNIRFMMRHLELSGVIGPDVGHTQARQTILPSTGASKWALQVSRRLKGVQKAKWEL